MLVKVILAFFVYTLNGDHRDDRYIAYAPTRYETVAECDIKEQAMDPEEELGINLYDVGTDKKIHLKVRCLPNVINADPRDDENN